MAHAEGTTEVPDPVAVLQRRVAELERELAEARAYGSQDGLGALQQSERRYRALVRATSHAVWHSDATGFGSEAWTWWESLTGQTQADGENWGWLDVVHPDDRERTREAWTHALKTLSDYDAQFRVKSRTGEWRHLRSRGVPLLDSRGGLIEWVGVFIDETDRQRLVNTLSGSDERFQTLFDLANFGVAETRIDDGRFVRVNRRLAELTGYTEAELLQRTLLDLTHPEDAADNAEAFAALRSGAAPSFNLERRYIRKDGGVMWVEAFVSLVRDADGVPLHAISIFKDRTALREAEATVRQSTARLKLVADSVPALISYVDRDFRYRLANRAYEEWFRMPREEVEGRRVPEVLGEAAFAQVRPSMEAALSGTPVQFEGWAPYSAGRRFIRATYVPDFESDGQVAGFAVLVEDLSKDRAAAELAATLNDELQQRVRDFEALFESMPIPVAIARDPAARDIRVNAPFAKILGATSASNLSVVSSAPGELPFRFVRDGVDVPSDELPQQQVQRSGTRIDNVELEVVRKDGARHHLYGSAVPLFDEHGGVRGSIAAYIDVTERKRHEQALKESERRLARLIETSPFGVAFGNFEGQVVYANDSFLNMVGYTREELSNGHLNWVSMTPTEWLPFDQRGAEELLKTGSATPFEKEYFRKDGSRVPILIGACLLNEPFAQQEQIVGFYLDLTERKHAELELQTTNAELRRINLDLEQFAYAAAHDLQEPLRMVSLYTQLFARRYAHLTDNAAEMMIRQIVGSSMRAQALVSDLLTYTRVIHGQAEEPDWVDCSEVAREVLNNLSAAISEAGAVVEVNDLPSVRISRSHLLQLLQNLVSNALKYARPDVAPEIRISARKDGSEYQIRVQDNGIGVKPEYQERIFGIFKRLHGREVPGTGIGLAICRRIVERYKGRIWVEDVEEQSGARFVFTLPFGD